MHGTVLIETKGAVHRRTLKPIYGRNCCVCRISVPRRRDGHRSGLTANGWSSLILPFDCRARVAVTRLLLFMPRRWRWGTCRFGRLRLKVKIGEGTIAVAPLSATFREGKITGGFKIDVTRDVPLADVDLRVAHLKLGLFDREPAGGTATTEGSANGDRAADAGGKAAAKGAAEAETTPRGNGSAAEAETAAAGYSGAADPPPVDGPLRARIALKGRGNSIHALASNATGTVTAVLPHGALRSSLAELAGLDLRGLGLMASGSKSDTGIRCAVASFDVKGGTLTAQRLLVDTDPVLISGQGTIDLDSEALDLQFEGRPKHPRLRVRAPLLVRGTLRHPAFQHRGQEIDGADGWSHCAGGAADTGRGHACVCRSGACQRHRLRGLACGGGKRGPNESNGKFSQRAQQPGILGRRLPGGLDLRGLDLVSPDFESRQHGGTEGHTDRDVGGIASAGYQYPANARHVVSRIERIPGAPDIRFKPTRKIHRRIDRRHADVTQIAGAVTGGDVETTA